MQCGTVSKIFQMVSPAICILTTALCLSSGFQQGYIANVLNQPYVAIENFINASWIQRYGKPVEPNTLVSPGLLNIKHSADNGF